MQKTLDSGAILNLTLCSFAEGTRLMKTVAKELKGTDIALGTHDKVGDILKMELGDKALNTIKNMITALLSSEEIEAALWPCMERGTYTIGGVVSKVNKDLFEDEKARADYIPILKEALVLNLSPFFKSLKSLLKDLPQVDTNTPR